MNVNMIHLYLSGRGGAAGGAEDKCDEEKGDGVPLHGSRLRDAAKTKRGKNKKTHAKKWWGVACLCLRTGCVRTLTRHSLSPCC